MFEPLDHVNHVHLISWCFQTWKITFMK